MRTKLLVATVFFSLMGFAGWAQLTQTNLPIIIISHSGSVSDTQILATMKIIDNGSGNNQPTDAAKFQGNVGFKFRGSSAHPKRSYNVETWTNLPNVSLDTSLLGLPAENDWVLLACYTDRSLLRNLLAFKLWEQMGYYAPRMKYVELIVNNDYKGIYLFGEKIKRSTNRLDLANLKITDATAPQITGGYIFRIDNSTDGYWTSNIAPPHGTAGQTIKFHFDEPDDNDITPVQKNYIRSYTDSFETALNSTNFQDTLLGWRGYAGHNSVEDYFLLNEVLKSRNAYRQDVYLYKDKSKKLRVGPVWDMDLALYNTLDCNAATDTGWAYTLSANCSSDSYLAPFWWQKLVADTIYMRDVACKYTGWRKANAVLDTTRLFAQIDSVSNLLNAQQAVTRNFNKYPIFGTSLVNEPTPLSPDYAGEVFKIKTFLRKRLQYLDAKWLSTGCVLGIASPAGPLSSVNIFPNPASGNCTVSIVLQKPSLVSIEVTDITGRQVAQAILENLTSGAHQSVVQMQTLSPGLYFITIKTDGAIAGRYKVVKR